MKNIWNEEYETMELSKLRKFQSEKLKEVVSLVYNKVPFYKKRMDELSVKPSDIKDIDSITKLPFTTKDDLRETYPYGLVAAHMDDIVEIHASSGTTGTPIINAYTRNDLEIWSEGMARTLAAGGVTKSDVLQNAYGYGLFTGGLGAHYGAKKIGATVIPISSGNTKRQLSMMVDLKATALSCTPSYSLFLAETGLEMGIDFERLPLKYGFFGAEAWSESMRKDIERKLNIKAYDIYGLTEIIGPGVASECECQNMMHINEDHFYPEIIDQKTLQVVPDGQKGELVITTITRDGSPVIRYRTRDITYITREKCDCGRTIARIHRLFGRTDDMLIIRGVNVFPTQIENLLLKIEGVEPQYQLIVERKGNLDTIEVEIEMNDKLFSDDTIGTIENLKKRIEHEINSSLLIHAKVTLVPPKSIPRSEGKAKRIIDKREI